MPSAAEAVVADVEALVGELSFKHFSLSIEISFSDLKMQFPEGISPQLVMCVPLPIKHISLVICVPLPIKTHIPSVMCSPTWETHIVICGPLPRKHISLYRQA